MRVTHNVQTFLPAQRVGGLWLLALGIALTPWFTAPCWAENYNLESVDFASSGGQTKIILHTGSIVPVQKVLTSGNKLILEIDQINSGETIRANFAHASNISHVIMQPINEHKVRMIVRGENLGTPTVAFYNASNSAYGSVNPAYEPQPSLSQASTQASSIQSTPATPLSGGIQAESEPINGSDNVDLTPIGDEDPIAFGGLIPEHKTSTTAEAPSPTSARPIATEPGQENAPLGLQGQETTTMGDVLLAQIAPYGQYITYGLLGLFLLGAGLFLRYRLKRLKQGPPGLEDLLIEQSQGQRVSFKEMANAYRGKHDQVSSNRAPAGRGGNHRKPSAEDVIGLRSLTQIDDPIDLPQRKPAQPAASPATAKGNRKAGAKPAPKQASQVPIANSLEQMLAAIQATQQPKTPIKTPAPKKQAVNQYLQQAKPKPKTRQAADEMMVQELKRAQAVQDELLQQAQQATAANAGPPVNRAMAAQKGAKTPNFQSVPSGTAINNKPRAPKAPGVNPNASAGQGPLPGNPEVLNFLRNVADLMEKDGKAEIAKSIHKNLSPNSLK